MNLEQVKIGLKDLETAQSERKKRLKEMRQTGASLEEIKLLVGEILSARLGQDGLARRNRIIREAVRESDYRRGRNIS